LYYCGPVFFDGFIEAVKEARFMGDGSGAGVRRRNPLLSEGISGSVRIGRLGIISKSAKKEGTPYSTPCGDFS